MSAKSRVWVLAMRRSLALLAMAFPLILTSCSTAPDKPPSTSLSREQPASLQGIAGSSVRIGAAVAGARTSPALADDQYVDLLIKQFGSLTPENQMKFRFIQPERGRFDFSGADEVANFARRTGKKLRGHTLVWHAGNPDWLNDLSCAEIRGVLREHIRRTVMRYRDVVYQWDVANEILDSSGRPRNVDNPFIRACGMGIVEDAFRWTHAASPEAALYLNDFAVEVAGSKFDGYVDLVQRLLERKVPIHGFGFQAHASVNDQDSWSLRDNMTAMTSRGLEVSITEAEVRLTEEEEERSYLDRQARAYSTLLSACLSNERCTSFTMWSFSDRYSWLKQHPRGYRDAGILDANLQPRPSFDALVHVLCQGTTEGRRTWEQTPGESTGNQRGGAEDTDPRSSTGDGAC